MNSISHYLPHEKPMILIDDIVCFGEDFIQTKVLIHKQSPFWSDNGVPAYVALEYMAQSVAAWNGLQLHDKHESPKIGFLLGTRKLILNVPFFKANNQLDVYATLKYSDGEMASFECRIECNNEKWAQAILSVYQLNNENVSNYYEVSQT